VKTSRSASKVTKLHTRGALKSTRLRLSEFAEVLKALAPSVATTGGLLAFTKLFSDAADKRFADNQSAADKRFADNQSAADKRFADLILMHSSIRGADKEVLNKIVDRLDANIEARFERLVSLLENKKVSDDAK